MVICEPFIAIPPQGRLPLVVVAFDDRVIERERLARKLARIAGEGEHEQVAIRRALGGSDLAAVEEPANALRVFEIEEAFRMGEELGGAVGIVLPKRLGQAPRGLSDVLGGEAALLERLVIVVTEAEPVGGGHIRLEGVEVKEKVALLLDRSI